MSLETNRIIQGDSFDALPKLPDGSIHAVVCDPPYGLNFMPSTTNGWDDFEPREYQTFCENWARECLRVLKPGGHLLAFSGNRTHHRLFTGVEDAGFEVRDTLTWHFGSGFPKASDISKTIDKRADADREVVGEKTAPDGVPLADRVSHSGEEYDEESSDYDNCKRDVYERAPATDAAKEWDGWKTGLKPATEFIVMARKPFDGATVDCVLEHGTGALNIEATRVEGGERPELESHSRDSVNDYGDGINGSEATGTTTEGRYPSNVAFDADAAAQLDADVGITESKSGGKSTGFSGGVYGDNSDEYAEREQERVGYDGKGGPSRYFKTVSWDGASKVLSGESTKDKIDCQLCNRTLVTSAEGRTKPTRAKPGSSAPTSATSTQSEEQTGEQNTPANNAGGSSKTTQTKTGDTAQRNVRPKPNKSEKRSNVNTAENNSKPSQATTENTAQNPASQKTSTENTSKQTGTTTTSNESERSSESDTTTNPSSEKRSKRDQKQTENTQKASPVKSVEIPARIGTTTTTINLLTCAGCAEAVTSNTTKKNMGHGGQDSPKRYKYTSKASRSERTHDGAIQNDHPTVKPRDLMEWLIKMVTREGQTVLDPFAGSGTTCLAAKGLGREFVGIERQAKWADVARVRCGLTPDDPATVREDDAQQGVEDYL